MPLYSLNKIERLVRTRQVYLRGVAGYNAGWVQRYASAADAVYTEFITATACEKGTDRRVEIGWDASGELAHVACDCGGCRTDGLCKHVVAVLVYKYYRDMIADKPEPARLIPRAGAAYTDTVAQQMIDRYMTQESAFVASDVFGMPVTLAAMLSLTDGRPAVKFTVSRTTAYAVKNIAQFVRRMRDGETAEYGKQLVFSHRREAFSARSLPLLDFLVSEWSERTTRPPSGDTPDTLWLTPAGADRFFAAAGSAVTVAPSGRTVPLVNGTPSVAVTVTREGDGVRLVSEQPSFAAGVQALYVLRDEAVYRTTADYTRRMTVWLNTMRQQPQGVYVAPVALGSFCAGVLATVKPYVTLAGDVDTLEPYQPRPMVAAIYLDAPAQDTITAAVKFDYGADAVDGFAPAAMPAVWRDILAERRVEAVVRGCFSHAPVMDGQVVLHGDDDILFSFVTDGVDALRQVGQVYATDAFKRLTDMPLTGVAVGLRLTGDWLDMTWDVGDLPLTELEGIITGYRENKPYHRLANGRFVRLEENAMTALAALAQTVGLSRQELVSGRVSLPKYRAFMLENLLRRHRGVTLSRDEAFRALTRRMREAGDHEYSLPKGLHGQLRDYQVTGYRWLRTMDELGLGGVLADDMGLGKTVQVIALLLAAKENAPTAMPSLVVCPTSVVLGWKQELARFAPDLQVLCVTGDAATRRELLCRASAADVLITSYDTLKRDIEQYAALHFRYHILDEAQYIKNSTTQNARAVKAIQASTRFALTGTPMENRLSELWSIMDFLLAGLLFSYPTFRAEYEVPIMRQQDSRALENLRRVTEPFVLRRLKQDVLAELPPKTERVLPAPLDEDQRLVYQATVQELRGLLRGGKVSSHSRMTVLALLMRLRQVCCDPRLCCEGYTGRSGKLEACVELLHEAADGGHKVLLFSQFTSMLALLQQRLKQEGLACYLLQGSTPPAERARMVEMFNADDTPVFLISLKAGGTGLNLTGADMVIHYDPWWNMAVQQQATDRAYRIGQKNPVQVVRLIAQDTIEERILRLQEDKWRLAESVVGATEPTIESMSAEELLALLQ